MTTVILPASNVANIRTLDLLDQMLTILGTTRTVLLPFMADRGTLVQSYGASVHDFTAPAALQTEFMPYQHPGGALSYYFDRALDNHLGGADHADFSGISGGVDAAFSIGAWCQPRLAGAQQTLMAKYDVAGTLREWQLGLSAAELINFELFDESIADANAAVSAPGLTALTLNQFAFVVATYGGEGGAPGFAGSTMTLAVYLNGVSDTGTVAGSGTDDYVDMENLAVPPMIGAADDAASPTFEFDGRIALPFICGKALSASEVGEIHILGRRLLGQ